MKRTAAITLNANMTPMIDVTFLLIVFFVVVSQIVDRNVIPLDLPTPENAKAMVSEVEHKLVFGQTICSKMHFGCSLSQTPFYD